MQIRDVMRRLRGVAVPVLAAWLGVTGGRAAPAAETGTQLPHLEKRGNAIQLVVDGQPYLMLAGELHNSSSSSLQYMQPLWPQLAGLHLNTVLVPVAWETIERQENHFDFSTVDGLLTGARNNHLKLVILWFGAWKNTYSTYVPAWVKTDLKRFPRVQTRDGRDTERLSPFSAAVRDA
ncbi:MAG TPA: beta-galactosidase, partial [Steroidobacteraceae bacterium]|nr:beta-galactosidase [Steroidobacteraceae bacterium]